MEDATIQAKDSSARSHHLFGVFDGHGGPEVAQFVEKHFHKEFLNNSEFQQGHYGQALIENFHKMDELLRKKTGRKEI
jgi:protein phosphatase 1G